MRCDLIKLFVDGVFNDHQSEILRVHIGQCEECQQELHKQMHLFTRILKPPELESRLLEACDDIISTALSLEQQAIFALLNVGIQFSQLRLVKQIEPMETGVMVDNNLACVIKLNWPSLSDVMFKHQAIVVVTMTFLPPYEHLNT
jgi:hypothetical protein